MSNRLCEGCQRDISHLDGQRRFCSSKCQRRGTQHSIYLPRALHELIASEAKRTGKTMTQVVEECCSGLKESA